MPSAPGIAIKTAVHRPNRFGRVVLCFDAFDEISRDQRVSKSELVGDHDTNARAYFDRPLGFSETTFE